MVVWLYVDVNDLELGVGLRRLALDDEQVLFWTSWRNHFWFLLQSFSQCHLADYALGLELLKIRFYLDHLKSVRCLNPWVRIWYFRYLVITLFWFFSFSLALLLLGYNFSRIYLKNRTFGWFLLQIFPLYYAFLFLFKRQYHIHRLVSLYGKKFRVLLRFA